MNQRMFRHTAHITIIAAAAALAATVAVLVPAVFKGSRTPAAPVPVFQSAVAKAAAVPTKQSLIDAVAVRLTLLRNIVASYDMDVNLTPPPPTPAMKKMLREIRKRMQKQNPGAIFGHTMSGNYTFRCRFSFLLGRVLYEKTMLPETVARLTGPGGDNAGIVKQIRSYTPARDEELNYNLHIEKHPFGVIQKALGLPMHLPIVWALGLCPPFLGPPSDTRWHWIGRKQLGAMAFTRIGADRFSLTQNRNSPASAYSIEQKKVVHSIITFEYQWVYRWKPKLELLSLKVFITDPPDRHALCLIGRCSDFQVVGGLMLPGKIVETGFAYPQVTTPVDTVTLTNLHYVDGDPANTVGSYFIVFPVGSQVLDTRSHGLLPIQINTRPRRLTDQALAKLELKNNLRRQQARPWQR